ncbi:MAG: polysaccharide deacetylase family protein [Bacteroidota bacterium]
MIIYAHTITSRLRYIADFIGKEINGNNFFQFTDSIETYRNSNDDKINYSPSRINDDELFLQAHSLLFETVIQTQDTSCFEINNYKAFFKTEGDFPFDIFAASFYLLSRYEEYLPHQKDMYGRYAHENSLAFRENFLQLPLINIWIKNFTKALQQKFASNKTNSSFTTHHSPFTYLPTYDIDEAYCYKFKPFWKNAGGFVRSFFKGEWLRVRERMKVLSGKQQDPYDTYQWMDQLHERFNLKPNYFFIVAGKTSKYDKNILPDKEAMQELIRQHKNKYPVGIHPSWQSGDDISLIRKEKESLEKIAGNTIVSSRQHYIRFTLPHTFRYLIDAGIEFDFSMGYGSINGFRASVASSFFWYDLEKESATKLLLYPFCYMDANSFFEQKLTAQQAYEETKQYYETVKAVNGTMISIWHNNFFGSSEIYKGWKEAYEKFISEL